jgi:hypothetical protein
VAMTAKTPQPFDGTAEVLHLIEACRRLRKLAPLSEAARDIHHWVDALEARYTREQPEPEPVGWHPRRWRELVAGDRVEMNGVEALVEGTVTNNWHVDPRSSEYRPEPLEHSVTVVRLTWGDPPATKAYNMPPDGEVETLRGDAGQAVDEANGFRSALQEEPVDVMASWAEDAAITLAAAGLGPVEVIR